MFMTLSRQAALLFALNFLDGVLTVYWVHNGFAEEGNYLMAGLLDIGYLPFLLVKIAVGALAATVLLHWRNLPVARYGLTTVVVIYGGLMGVHLITGLAAGGVISEAAISDFAGVSNSIFAFFN